MDGFGGKGSTSFTETISDYKLGNEIGEGGFAKVRRAIHIPTGINVAIKIIDCRRINDSAVEQVRREIKIQRQFSHPHIVRFCEAIITKSKIYIIMEYMSGGDLFDYITVNVRIEEPAAKRLFQQIISGVECCHHHMVAHRDLKPENILLDLNQNIKIADFGLSNIMLDGHFMKENSGSQHYAAPEVLQRRIYAGPEVDVWSCGVILYVLLCGRLPFEGDFASIALKKILHGAYLLPSNLSIGARDLISRMLVIDPVTRLSISEIRKHPWFQQQLPRYLATPSISAASKMENINKDVVISMAKMGFDVRGVIQSLQNGVKNKETLSYFMLLDNWRQGHSNYLDDELSESQPLENKDCPEIYMRSPDNSQTKWAIGFQFEEKPHKKMRDVLTILHRLNVRWKGLGHYNIRCLWAPKNPTCPGTQITYKDHNPSSSLELSIATKSKVMESSENAVKFEIQLYKASEELYLLDIQRTNGPPFLFLDLCAKFLAMIKA